MKLYARTTSERASKGQGGEWLRIEIINEKRQKIAYIVADISQENHTPYIKLYYEPSKVKYIGAEMSLERMDFLEGKNFKKGKSQKGEQDDLERCPSCKTILPDLDHMGGCPEN